MERALYDSLKAAERSWWYRGRSAAVRAFLSDVKVPTGPALDFGAGYGAMLPVLAPHGEVDAYDVFPDCVAACRARGYRVAYGDLGELRTKRGYGLIGAFDVLEHIDDDAEAVRMLRSMLLPNGVLMITVPAHPFMWSEHDVGNHHVRRYTKAALRKVLEENGFVIERLSYWNASLFPVAYLLRLMGRGGKEGLVPAAPINAILTFVVSLEALWLRLLPLPMGLSLIVRARPKAS